MAVAASPEIAARTRYNASFTSSIFDGPQAPKPDGFVPAGKRRDQTTSEMFGNYAEKDLRGMPKTFVPKEDTTTARSKKIQFLSSEVLPHNAYPAQNDPAGHMPTAYASAGYPEDEDDESKVDTHMVRQMHLSSSMFGRPTPNSAEHQDRSNRLVPNDFVWNSYPEPLPGDAEDTRSHADRAYEQKCSRVFDYQSPEMRHVYASEKQETKKEEQADDLKRRANVYYSDLFGRSAEMAPPEEVMSSSRRPKSRGSNEDQIVVHQDWTDSRTELLHGARAQKPEQPHLRKGEELHQNRVFAETNRGDWSYPERLDAVTHDNSSKVRSEPGMTTQAIHQAHMRTSIQAEDFYQTAYNSKDWEVIELHISGLPFDADDEKVRSLCSGFDLQIVKAKADIDPVRNLCKGRAKVTVRYNPVRDSIEALIRHLEARKLSVDT
mmetsp:Transcript_37983/g.68638  ORF Transcript_37983/g.68638 Transcript_37983/m.68638 type:complete len:435 (+) Transcript_37983:63-1367(+)